MFKGKILKFSGNEAIVLSDTLRYEKIELKAHMEVGQNIYYFEEDLILESSTSEAIELKDKLLTIISLRTLGPILAVLMMAILLFNESTILHSPIESPYYGVVSIDINPSMTLIINEEGIVEHAEGKNNDGLEVIESVSILKQPLELALERIINASENFGYLDKNNQIFIATTDNFDKTETAAIVNKALDEMPSDDSYTVYVANVDFDNYEKAEKKDVSLGQYIVEEKSANSSDVFSPTNIEQLPSLDKHLPSSKKNNHDKEKITEDTFINTIDQEMKEKETKKIELEKKKKDIIEQQESHKVKLIEKKDEKKIIQEDHKTQVEDNKNKTSVEEDQTKNDAVLDKNDEKFIEKEDHKVEIQEKKDEKVIEKEDHKLEIQDKKEDPVIEEDDVINEAETKNTSQPSDSNSKKNEKSEKKDKASNNKKK